MLVGVEHTVVEDGLPALRAGRPWGAVGLAHAHEHGACGHRVVAAEPAFFAAQAGPHHRGKPHKLGLRKLHRPVVEVHRSVAHVELELHARKVVEPHLPRGERVGPGVELPPREQPLQPRNLHLHQMHRDVAGQQGPVLHGQRLRGLLGEVEARACALDATVAHAHVDEEVAGSGQELKHHRAQRGARALSTPGEGKHRDGVGLAGGAQGSEGVAPAGFVPGGGGVGGELVGGGGDDDVERVAGGDGVAEAPAQVVVDRAGAQHFGLEVARAAGRGEHEHAADAHPAQTHEGPEGFDQRGGVGAKLGQQDAVGHRGGRERTRVCEGIGARRVTDARVRPLVFLRW